jgi:PAS domain S-box-containing protein
MAAKEMEGRNNTDHRFRAVAATFRNILLVVLLIFVFAVAQTYMVWRVCNAGMNTAMSLQKQGLPTLDALALLQEHLAIYRLNSYEYLFAKEGEKGTRAKALDTVAAETHAELEQIKRLLPEEEGQNLASKLERAINELDGEFQKVRSMTDTDFAGAMKEMDDHIPARTAAVAGAEEDMKRYGYNFSSREASATFGSFGWIRSRATFFGALNIMVAFGAVVFVLLAARRSSTHLSETLERLAARTRELQHANESLKIEVIGHERAEETLRESEERFSNAFEHAPIGVALVSMNGDMVKVNRAFCEVFGMPEEELLARKFQELTGREEHVENEQNVVRLLGGEIRSFQSQLRHSRPEGDIVTALSNTSVVRDAFEQPMYYIVQIQDISERKRAEIQLEDANRRLVDMSRQTGMAEVATSVLHNVGNVLNSVNVSATIVADALRSSTCGNLGKVAKMIEDHDADLGHFITEDKKGRLLPKYIRQLSDMLARENETAVEELGSLCTNIDHIKEIVAKQQSYAKVSGVLEMVEVAGLVEDSVRMNAAALSRHEVSLTREYEDVPPITVDKHKVLQILVNLIRNAKYACDDGGREEKQMVVRIANCEDRVRISVIDNGVGIPAENLVRIFNHGFTTRRGGHGFGLHSGALAAKELGGTLVAQSEGPGMGATFTLELPIAPNSDSHSDVRRPVP